MKKLIALIAFAAFLSGCGGSSSKPTQQTKVSVSISPSTQQTIDQGQTVHFTASVTNDTNNQGVSWSLSGSGCSGSACGTLTNTTATAATYIAPANVSSSLTVSVKATSVKDTSVSVSDTVVVNPAPAVTTPSLPNGTVATAYSATLQGSGGTGSLSWSITSGSLPNGLSLNSRTGVISGTPTASGTSTFTVEVTDSASTPLSAQKQLSITIENQVMVITTTSLSNGTVGVAYTTTLQVNYATPPVSWSISSGTLPNGLALDASTGVISGAPTASGTSTFTVMVTDSTTPTSQTATQSLSIKINAAGANNSVLNGHYAFLLSGYDTNGNRVAVAGSFVADGSGGVTSGVEDVNDTGSAPGTNLTFTGNYAVGTDNRGTITITNSASATYTMAIALGTFNAGTAGKGSILEFDTSGYTMSGVIELQDTTAFSTLAVNGSYAFGFTGSDPNMNRLGIAGKFTTSGSGSAGVISSGLFDENDNGTIAWSSGEFTGTYSVNSNGRGQATIVDVSPAPTDYALYIVSASKWLAISLDPAVGLVTGEVDAQSGGPFTASSLNATEVVGVGAAAGSGGSHLTLGLATFDGSSNVSFSFDENDAGTLSTQSGTGTYTVASTGRFTLTPQNSSKGLVGYLITANQGFILSTDDGVAAGTFQKQSAGPFTNASLDLTAFFGTESFAAPPVAPPQGGSLASLSVGVVTLDGAGKLSVTSDTNELGTLQSNQIDTDTYSVSSNGRVTLGSGSLILYIVSPTRVVTMSTNANDPNPTLGFGRQ